MLIADVCSAHPANDSPPKNPSLIREGTRASEKLALKYGALNRVLVNKLYMDDMYQWGIDRVALAFSGAVAWFDRVVVNDIGVNGAADTVRNAGYRIRYLESGLLYNYALGMTLGVVAVALFWWLVIPRIV